MLPMLKKRTVECSENGVYCNLALSIDFSVTSAAACLTSISLLSTLDEVKTLIASSFSNIFPSQADSTSRILPSVSFSNLFEKEPSVISELYHSSKLILFIRSSLNYQVILF